MHEKRGEVKDEYGRMMVIALNSHTRKEEKRGEVKMEYETI